MRPSNQILRFKYHEDISIIKKKIIGPHDNFVNFFSFSTNHFIS